MTTEHTDRLLSLERQLLEAQKCHDVALVSSLLADDFREVGASGRLYRKADVLNRLPAVQILEYSLREPTAIVLGSDCVLLTYASAVRRRLGASESQQCSYRISVWIKRQGNWQVLSHQGTPIP